FSDRDANGHFRDNDRNRPSYPTVNNAADCRFFVTVNSGSIASGFIITDSTGCFAIRFIKFFTDTLADCQADRIADRITDRQANGFADGAPDR
ncbi:MAG: hypothetical protein IIU42_03165, partial [Ruminococcus sp.]|nr:hypothetical protein [Ruminococcus sp.]